MSALNDLIDTCQDNAKQYELETLLRTCEAARAELAALRAKAAEYERIADLIDPNGAWTDTPIYDQIVNLLHDDSSEAALRATLDGVREVVGATDGMETRDAVEKFITRLIFERDAQAKRIANQKESLKNCETVMLEQAKQIEAAYELLDSIRGVSTRDLRKEIDAWLAANAPQPKED